MKFQDVPRTPVLIFAAVLSLILVGAGIALKMQRDTDIAVRSSALFLAAMDRVEDSEAAGLALGQPVTVGWGIDVEPSGALVIPLSGPLGSGILEVMEGAGGDFAALILRTDDAPIDLLALEAEQSRSAHASDALSRGEELVEAGRMGEAVIALDEVLASAPDSAHAWYLRGLARFEMKQLEEAEPDLLQAIQLQPGETEARALLGMLYHQQGRHDDCIAAFTELIRMDDEDGRAWYNRAVCYENKGERRQALAGAREGCANGLESACKMQERLKRDTYELSAL